LRPDFDAALPDERAPAAFDEDPPEAFAEDFDFDDFDEALRAVFADDLVPEALRELLADEPAEDLRDAAFAVRETAFDARPATLRAVRSAAAFSRAAVETAFSIAVFAPEGPSVAGPGRIMSPAVGLTVPTASAAVSSAALASPAACSPACPISLEAVPTAPPRTPRATSSAPPPLFFFVAIFTSVER
jgi:hypothetical protein